VVISYVVFAKCNKEAEPQPEPPKLVPEITDISPDAGFVGMHVVIEGKNFSKTLAENTVKFAGVNASVVDADENSIEVIVPAGGTTGVVTVIANDATATGPAFKYHDLYLLGNQIVDNKNYVKLWRNGIVSDISDQSKYYYGTSFAVSGNDVFISGYHFDGQISHPVYWKNTQVHPLSAALGIATDIFVNGSDIYVSGYEHNGTHFIAMYWKNDVRVELSEGLYSNDGASSIDMLNGDVLIGGYLSTSSTESTAAFWKNEAMDPIEKPLGSSTVADVEVEGQDVHMVGPRILGSKQYITYWENGVAKDITSGEFTADATSVSVIEGDVYITGYEYTQDGNGQAKVWNITREQVINVTGGPTYSVAKGVAKIDNMLVVCGQRSSGQGQLPFYTINGEYYPVTEIGSNVEIYGIYVK